MTIIAYKDGIIAYDSRCCCGPTIVDDDYDKHTEVDGVHFFLTGSTSDHPKLIEIYFSKPRDDYKTTAQALIWDSGKLCSFGFTKEGEFYENPEKLSNVMSFGSGEDHALTAMDCGLTAKQAVKMAMKRDAGSGGRIRTFKVKT